MGMKEVTAVFNAIDNVSSVAANIGDNIASMGQSTGDWLTGAAAGFDGVAGAALEFAGGALPIVAAGIGMAVDATEEMNHALAGVQARTGMSSEAMKGFRKDVENAFNTGLVDNFDKAARAVEAVQTKIHGLEGDQATQQFTTDVLAMSKAWGTSSDKIVNDVQIMQQKFGDLAGDPVKALNLLTATAQDSHLPLDKINQILTQTSGKFQAAGLDATSTSQLIVQGANNGITNFTQLSTVVDKFHQNIAKPPPGFNTALSKMGLNDVAYQLRTNKISMDSALDAVFTKFSKMPDGIDKSKLAMDLFGKSVDKIGGADQLAKLAGFTKGLDNVNNAADNVANVMQDDGTLGTAIKRVGNNIKTWFEDKAQGAYNAIKNINWKQIGDSINHAIDGAKATWNDWFGPSGKIATFVNQALNVARGFINASGLGNAFSAITSAIGDTWNKFFGPTGSVSKPVGDALKKAQDFASGALAGISSAFGAIGKAASDALAPILHTIDGILKGLAAIGAAGPMTEVAGGAGWAGNKFVPKHAFGGSLDEGWNMVGEEGPELIHKTASRTDVFSNAKSQRMISGAGAGGNGSPLNIYLSAGNVVGEGGMQEFARILYKKFQMEDQRRGQRT